MRYPIQEFPFYSYPQIYVPINHTPTVQTNSQQHPFPYFNPGVYAYPNCFGLNQMQLVSHSNRSMTYPTKSSNEKTPKQKNSIKNERAYISPTEEEKYIEKKIKKNFSSLATLTSSPEAEDSSSSNQSKKKFAYLTARMSKPSKSLLKTKKKRK